MKTTQVFKQTLLAASISMLFPAMGAWADDEVEELISPNASEVTLKVQNVNEINSLYREYTGLNHEGINGSVDLNLVRRSEEGRWLKLQGRDLGLDTQELKAEVEQQGDWAVKFGYNQIPHYSTVNVHTAVGGIGSTSLQLPANLWGTGASFSDQHWKTERTATSIGLSKYLSDNLLASFSFKNEDKKGTRLMTSGGNAPAGGAYGAAFFATQYLTPEPIDNTHQQLEASLGYATDKFQLTGNYYGSFFKNKAGNALFVTPSSTTTQAYNSTNMSPLSLAPDNQANEFSLTGGYNWSKDTRATFSVGKTFAIQNADFISSSLLIPTTAGKPATLTSRTNLGGKVDTTNFTTAFSSRLTSNFSVAASWAYEDRNDKTPRDIYLIDYAHGNQTTAYTNNPESMTTNRGKLEGVYQFGNGYRLITGIDYDEKRYKGMEEEGYRERTDEETYRIGLRKVMSETLNGAVTLSHSERSGSDWGSTPSIYGDHWIAPTQFSDRKRDKLKFMLDWSPLQAANFQVVYEHSQDDYSSRTNNMGLDKGSADLLSLDASYQITDNWKTNAWYSLGYNQIKQNERQNPRLAPTAAASIDNSDNIQTCDGTTAGKTCTLWSADLDSKTQAFGAGIFGKLSSRIDVGAQYQYSRDVNQYKIKIGSVVAGSAANSPVLSGAGVLPDTLYQLNSLHLFGKYTISKATSVRLDFLLDDRKLDDYTWSQYRYSDGTTVYIKPHQITHLIGVSLTQAF
jgi:MtrB/PioB family decaheme-associated outer membrane protein